LDLADKIIQAVNSSREQINQVKFGEVKLIIQEGKVIRTEINQKINASKTA